MYLLRQAYIGDAIDEHTLPCTMALDDANKVAKFGFDW
jgi:hypothetical protein